jgi:hypothetical protein
VADQIGGSLRAGADQRLLRTVTRFQARRRADRRIFTWRCWRILVAETRRLSDLCSDNDQLRAGRQHPGYPGLAAMALT